MTTRYIGSNGNAVDVTPANPLPVTGVVADGPSTSSSAALTPVVTSVLATSRVIKASAGNLYGLNLKATTVPGTFLVHDAAAAPASGAVTPVKAYDCPAQGTVEVQFDPPLRFATGISVTFSIAATPFTQTDSATAFISGDAA